MSFEKYVKYLPMKCLRKGCEGDLILVEGGQHHTLLKCLRCLRNYELKIGIMLFNHLLKRHKEEK